MSNYGGIKNKKFVLTLACAPTLCLLKTSRFEYYGFLFGIGDHKRNFSLLLGRIVKLLGIVFKFTSELIKVIKTTSGICFV